MHSTKLTGWRRIAAATWPPPDNPQIYGAIECDARPIESLVAAAREAGVRLTPTHLVGRALARAIAEVPDVNVRLMGCRAVPRPTVDIFFTTAVEGGRDLSGVKVERADMKSAFDVARELNARSFTLKSGRDAHFARMKHVMEALPHPLLRAALRLSGWIAGEHALGIPPLGLAPSPFGSAMITSVGMLGLPMGFAPLSSLWNVPILLLIGEIQDKPVIETGLLAAGRVLPLSATFDHRYMDGSHISRLLRHFRAYLRDPRAFEPPI